MTAEIEQILPAYLMRATGYNQNDPEGWSHPARVKELARG
jgi:hypothetical protein